MILANWLKKDERIKLIDLIANPFDVRSKIMNVKGCLDLLNKAECKFLIHNLFQDWASSGVH